MPAISVFMLVLTLLKLSCADETCSETIDITEGIKDETNIVFDGITYAQKDYISNSTGLFGCICNVQNCVQECCNPGESLDISSGSLKCVASTSQAYTNLKSPILHNIIHVRDRQICTEEEVKITLNASEDSLELKERGYLHWEDSVYNYNQFCISTSGNHVLLVLCVVPDYGVSGMLYSLGMIISMPFLLITFLVYAILPDTNLHQRALMFYVLTLLLSYILMVAINLSTNIAKPWCDICGYSTLYFFMSSFFWMNVICFDIWYTFSGGRGFVGSKRTSERKKLFIYSLYAFGVPLLVVNIVILMQKTLPTNSPHNPGIGVGKCFLADGWPNLWYFYGEAIILVVANIAFFFSTAFKIRQVKKETSMLKHNDSKRHSFEKDKQKFNLYLKLLFAMGANWTMEVISWIVNWRTGGTVQYIWYATDFFNAISGVFIFFMFVFKKKVWKLLQRRYYNFIGKPHLAHTMTSTNTRTSHYSSTNYSTADTNLSDRTTATNGRTRAEEIALRRAP